MALIKCNNCGKEISDTTNNCIHCGAAILKPEEKPKKKKMSNSTKIIIGISIFIGVLFLIGSIVFTIVIINAVKAPNLKDIAEKVNCGTYYCDVATDGSYLKLDTNPLNLDDYSSSSAYDIMKRINSELNLPQSINEKIASTRAIDGRLKEEYDDLEISWTYHPDKGLEILYEIDD